MLTKVPYIIYFIALIIIIFPTFFLKNNNYRVFIKNLLIWAVLFAIIIFIYKKYIII